MTEYYSKEKGNPFKEIEGRRPPMSTKGRCKAFIRNAETHVVSMCYMEIEKDGRCPLAGHHVVKLSELEKLDGLHE